MIKKGPLRVKLKTTRINLLEKKLADLVSCNLRTTLGQNTLSDLMQMHSSDHII